jgi:hypothetical protein
MKTVGRLKLSLIGLILFLHPAVCGAQQLNAIQLPSPQTDIGRPLMQVLKDQSSTRSFSPTPLPAQTMSNLLWAAFGINRPDGKRTAPSASSHQEIDIYVAVATGLSKTDGDAAERDMDVAADMGFVAQNVYLYCAPERLATVVRGSIDRRALSQATRLRADQRIILAQTVGYPKS